MESNSQRQENQNLYSSPLKNCIDSPAPLKNLPPFAETMQNASIKFSPLKVRSDLVDPMQNNYENCSENFNKFMGSTTNYFLPVKRNENFDESVNNHRSKSVELGGCDISSHFIQNLVPQKSSSLDGPVRVIPEPEPQPNSSFNEVRKNPIPRRFSISGVDRFSTLEDVDKTLIDVKPFPKLCKIKEIVPDEAKMYEKDSRLIKQKKEDISRTENNFVKMTEAHNEACRILQPDWQFTREVQTESPENLSLVGTRTNVHEMSEISQKLYCQGNFSQNRIINLIKPHEQFESTTSKETRTNNLKLNAQKTPCSLSSETEIIDNSITNAAAHKKFGNTSQFFEPEMPESSISPFEIRDSEAEILASSATLSKSIKSKNARRDLARFHYDNLINSLRNLRREEYGLDTILLCRGGYVKAHSCILACTSEYLKNILREVKDFPTVISVPDVNIKTMESLISCIYRGNSSAVAYNVEEVLEAAMLLQMNSVSSILSQILHRKSDSVAKNSQNLSQKTEIHDRGFSQVSELFDQGLDQNSKVVKQNSDTFDQNLIDVDQNLINLNHKPVILQQNSEIFDQNSKILGQNSSVSSQKFYNFSHRSTKNRNEMEIVEENAISEKRNFEESVTDKVTDLSITSDTSDFFAASKQSGNLKSGYSQIGPSIQQGNAFPSLKHLRESKEGPSNCQNQEINGQNLKEFLFKYNKNFNGQIQSSDITSPMSQIPYFLNASFILGAQERFNSTAETSSASVVDAPIPSKHFNLSTETPNLSNTSLLEAPNPYIFGLFPALYNLTNNNASVNNMTEINEKLKTFLLKKSLQISNENNFEIEEVDQLPLNLSKDKRVKQTVFPESFSKPPTFSSESKFDENLRISDKFCYRKSSQRCQDDLNLFLKNNENILTEKLSQIFSKNEVEDKLKSIFKVPVNIDNEEKQTFLPISGTEFSISIPNSDENISENDLGDNRKTPEIDVVGSFYEKKLNPIDPIKSASNSPQTFMELNVSSSRSYTPPLPNKKHEKDTKSRQKIIPKTFQITPRNIQKPAKFEKKSFFASMGRKRKGCGECEGCQILDDCGECRFCLDKSKFGGPNRLKQVCMAKKCVSLEYTSPELRKKKKSAEIKLLVRCSNCEACNRKTDCRECYSCLSNHSSNNSNNNNNKNYLFKKKICEMRFCEQQQIEELKASLNSSRNEPSPYSTASLKKESVDFSRITESTYAKSSPDRNFETFRNSSKISATKSDGLRGKIKLKKKNGGSRSTNKARTKYFCGDCKGCKTNTPCGTCLYCQDMPKFGGLGRYRQKCVTQLCVSHPRLQALNQSNQNKVTREIQATREGKTNCIDEEGITTTEEGNINYIDEEGITTTEEGNINNIDDKKDTREGNVNNIDEEGNTNSLDDKEDSREGNRNYTGEGGITTTEEGNINNIDDKEDTREGNTNYIDEGGITTTEEGNINNIDDKEDTREGNANYIDEGEVTTTEEGNINNIDDKEDTRGYNYTNYIDEGEITTKEGNTHYIDDK